MNRHKKSGGQALILVTLGLLAMCGMMGLAVDMGWSFFVHKEAQTSADAAALAAVTEGFKRLNGSPAGGFSCASTLAGVGAGLLECRTTATSCSTVVATGSNLDNGCQYAKRNGFDWTTSRQGVTIQSNDGQTANLPPTAPGVVNITYWVTVRTVQTVPQLFSAVVSRTEGTVSAVATAAIAASVGPGDFYGMNRAADCTNSGKGAHCGADLVTSTGQGSTQCPAPYTNTNGQVCAPMGIVLSSSCNTTQKNVCDDGWAGNSLGAGVAGGSLTIMQGGIVNTKGGGYHDMNNVTLVPQSAPPTNSLFDDFYKGKPDPPIQATNGIGACGYLNGTVPSTVTTLGPYQYYSFHVGNGGVKVPDGQPIQVPTGVTFDSTFRGACPNGGLPNNVDDHTAGGTAQAAAFPDYVFWGGLYTGNTATFGAGQYVMAGTTSQTGAVFSIGGSVSGNGQTSINGNSSTGTMFIFTDGQYPGLATQSTFIANSVPTFNSVSSSLYQGTLAFKNSTVNLTGVINSTNGSGLPPALDDYSGIAWWQDRRNSYADGYNKASGSAGCSGTDCTGDDGQVIYCVDAGSCTYPSTAKLNAMKTANHVTPTSAGFNLQPGNVNMNIDGAFYQPRGAWTEILDGTGNIGGPLQIVTGALIEDNGNARVLLAGPTNPIITYRPVLIH